MDYVIDTVAAKHSLGPILDLLKVSGTLVLVGAPDKPVELPSFPLIFGKILVLIKIAITNIKLILVVKQDFDELIYICLQGKE